MKKLFKHMSIYGIGGILTKTISFLLVPIYTRVLVPADYGVLELVYTAGSLIGILYGFMISSGYIRNYYDCKDENSKKVLLGSAFWFTFINSTVFALLSCLFANEIASAVFEFSDGGHFLKLVSISTAIYAPSQVFYGLLQVEEKSKEYVATNVFTLLATLGLTVYFVIVLRWAVQGVLYAQIIGRVLQLLVLAFLALRKTMFQFSFRLINEMLKYSIPLIPVQLAAFVLNLSNRFFLQEYTTLDQVGLYSLGYKLSSVLLLFTVQPLRAFTPYICSLIDTPGKCKKILADFTRYYIFGILTMTLVISVFSREVISIMADKSYYSSWKVVFLITLSQGFYSTAVLSSVAIDIVKKTWISSALWILAAIINVICNFLLIPQYGILGASLAMAICYLVVLIGYWTATRYIYPVPYEYTSFFGILALGTIVYYLSTFVNFGIVLSITLKSGLLLLFVAVSVLGGYFTKEEIARARKALSGIGRALRVRPIWERL